MRCYAVLAPVSRSYSPLGGRLVTCYSPGRHFTHGLLHFLVRLACVRHAASVDSEPGSNSRLKPVRPPTGRRWAAISIARKGCDGDHSDLPSGLLQLSDPVAYLVRSFQTNARIRSLTTGTFNRVVKDRIALRLSGANSVQAKTHECDSDCPRNLTTIRCGAKPCQRKRFTAFPPVFHNWERRQIFN